MISRLNSLEKYLNYLLLFLFPTQLAVHFWPKYAFVYGIRVDYLSPTIYTTDVIFIFLFILWIVRAKKTIFPTLTKGRWVYILFLVVSLFNIFSSISFFASLFKWLKLVEFVALGFYVYKREEIFSKSVVSNILFLELVLFSLIGILQVFRGQTIGGIFYYLGERSFTTETPGIALTNVIGNSLLRAYSTFSHPNSFAGFGGVLFIYLLFNKPNLNKYILVVGWVLAVVAFLLTVSFEAFIATTFCLVVYLVYKNRNIIKTHISNFFLFAIISSLIFMLLSNVIMQTKLSLTESVGQRLELGIISGNMLKNFFLFGSGLNTFTLIETAYSNIKNTVWLLQPVHNIFILVFVETGIVGLLFFFVIINRFLNIKLILQNMAALMIIIFVLTTGIFDHYWFTLQQNMLLISFLVGMFLQKNNNKFLVK